MKNSKNSLVASFTKSLLTNNIIYYYLKKKNTFVKNTIKNQNNYLIFYQDGINKNNPNWWGMYNKSDLKFIQQNTISKYMFIKFYIVFFFCGWKGQWMNILTILFEYKYFNVYICNITYG